ncbi:hypothetical protein SAMN06265219_110182 [Gracilimonas mengyeensis]|uniref:Uncharacterized protein n=1 Tax=Gracilimonas mengyeensis TaxID=1302730 RepID=A0A521E5I4_9BACT|nr:hypothetical protein SAMN06265219_110182 [Gracilimonas mengyeensis]
MVVVGRVSSLFTLHTSSDDSSSSDDCIFYGLRKLFVEPQNEKPSTILPRADLHNKYTSYN